ncbi:TPA: hypothetical protein ACWZV4_002268 [Streptococcus agalactiae]|nr:hypothetical protein [Streptococcus agalactiae]HEN6056350.1 hypothetical protein [Streptococcus agalactiae]HEN6140124.1 hypothetical protein [Streptococcus agalactiae]HEN6140443.1 hypothetical protein [Streptococcus agalactiae]HEN7029785.1 hypothetical protein [Streptococcus agalactiae]
MTITSLIFILVLFILSRAKTLIAGDMLGVEDGYHVPSLEQINFYHNTYHHFN